MALSYTTALRNTRLTAIATALNAAATAGKIRVYDGTPPASVNDALSGNTQLAELPLSDPSELTITGGVFTLDAITQDASADASGTASFFRGLDGDNNPVIQGTVGTSGADMNLNSVNITVGGTVSCTSAVITAGNA